MPGQRVGEDEVARAAGRGSRVASPFTAPEGDLEVTSPETAVLNGWKSSNAFWLVRSPIGLLVLPAPSLGEEHKQKAGPMRAQGDRQ